MKPLLLTTALVMAATSVSANRAFVSNERGNTVTVIDTETWQVETEFFAGNRPRGITVSPDGTLLYVCASDDDQVKVFSTETFEELYSLPSGPRSGAVHPASLWKSALYRERG